METDEEQRVLPFQLQFDRPVASQIKIAEWNPEKDLLAMVTEDSKILLHRFNWQRLWTISPGRSIKSLCWRPDGKAIAVGLEDGTVSLHDVENGKLLRSLKSHTVAVVCLNWEEDRQLVQERSRNILVYEDRTPRFFPPAPRVPRMPGLVSGDSGFMDDNEDSFRELSNYSHQRFNILCSGDKDGSICFSIFGIFPIGKINIHKFSVSSALMDKHADYRLLNASIYKVALSKDLCSLTVLCSAELNGSMTESAGSQIEGNGILGFHCLVLDTSIFLKRKNELHQVAQQASSIEDLNEVIRSSLSVMSKQWSDAMHSFHEKFNSLTTLIIDHGLDSSPQEEFLSLLSGARTSPPVHQFLVNSLGEVGVKRVSKVVPSAGKELQRIVLDHLQPAAEIIGFRIGELRGLSRWRARYQNIGLDEALIDKAMEKSGMLLVQIERFMRVLSSVMQQFSNFFSWLLKCIKILMQEPSDQLLPYNSELVIIFLKFLYDQDPVKQLLELSEDIEVDSETIQRVQELVRFGGFSDCEYLRRTLASEFQQMETCFKEAFQMPFITISRKILCEDLQSLFPLPSPPLSLPVTIPIAISYYEDASQTVSSCQPCRRGFLDYVSFRIPNEPSSDIANCVGIARGFTHDVSSTNKVYVSFEAVLLAVPAGYHCIDLSLYKESQIVLLLNEVSASSESSGDAFMMILQASDLPFASLSRSPCLHRWKMHQLKDSIVFLQMENQKVRNIPHSVVAPLAVSASRGVACVFAARKRALVYILEEDEDEVSDSG
ncbi:Transducin/WD40 repeat-like superfamily protein isoform 1 [Tripterygium wilfordii]|uniref:Anaphase-promoting complex subunit 4 n=1 Tax=Tripterygium wilfordii TaxID=458696 RepID=A0A7J7C499_TRIWF|nr:anaphase-promoting complex subunit 4 [Tripterygium wilfordii]KAF5728954.1 Transducin/WD40 repeat-like superfamily protein isoform 1 [Tripterygium wilfordii]